MRWKDWNWLHDGVLPLTIVIQRVCWLWLWLPLLQQLVLPAQPRPLLPAPLMVALLLAGRWTGRVTLRLSDRLVRARLATAVAGLAILFLTLWGQLYRADYALWDWHWLQAWGEDVLFWGDGFPAVYFLLPAVALLWLRGILDGGRLLEPHSVRQTFLASSLAIVGFLLIGELTPDPLPPETGLAILLFFAAAMAALAISSLKLARRRDLGELAPDSLNRYWLGSVLGVITLLLALGLGLSLILAPETVVQLLDWLWGATSGLLILLVKITSLLLYPVLLLLAWLVGRIAAMLQHRGFDFPFDSEMPERFVPTETPGLRPEQAASLPDELRWLSLLIALLLVGVAFALALRRWSREMEGIEETRESIFSGRLLLAQLSGWWSGRRRPERSGAGALSLLPLSGLEPGRRAVREIYQALLTAARSADRPRRPEHTPLTYAARLAPDLTDDERDALRVITDEYLQARYNAIPLSDRRVAAVRDAWERLRAAFNRERPPADAGEGQ